MDTICAGRAIGVCAIAGRLARRGGDPTISAKTRGDLQAARCTDNVAHVMDASLVTQALEAPRDSLGRRIVNPPPRRRIDDYDRTLVRIARPLALQAIEVLGQILHDAAAPPQHRIAAARELLAIAAPKGRRQAGEDRSGKLTNSQKREVIDALKEAAAQARKRTVTLEARVVEPVDATCEDANSS